MMMTMMLGTRRGQVAGADRKEAEFQSNVSAMNHLNSDLQAASAAAVEDVKRFAI